MQLVIIKTAGWQHPALKNQFHLINFINRVYKKLKKSNKVIILKVNRKILIFLTALALIISALFAVIEVDFISPKSKIISQKTPFKATLSKADKSIKNFFDVERKGQYPFACNPWDMKTYGDNVFICCGDYSINSGDAPIFSYNKKTKKFDIFDVLTTEQNSRFYVFDNKLYTTAADPVFWGFGEFYSLTENQERFDCYECLPSNIHCFDMVDFDGKFFLCGSVIDYENYSMVQCIDKNKLQKESFDNTKQVFFYKNGKKLGEQECYRVYDMFVYKGNLYAWHYDGYMGNDRETYTGLYVYNKEKDRFDYIEDEKSLSDIMDSNPLNEECESYMFFQSKFEFKGKMVFVNRNIYYTEDLKNYTQCSLGKGFENYVIRDAIEIEGQIYAVGSQKLDNGKYKTSVFVTDDLKKFSELFNFETESYINCFEYIDKTFVFGEGGSSKNTAATCGNLYTVEVK